MNTRAKATMSTATSTRTTSTTTTSTTATSGTAGTSRDSSIPPAEPIFYQNRNPTYVRMRMPTIVTKNINAWFTSVDYWFQATGVHDDETKFASVCAAIDTETLQRLEEELREAPQNGKYAFLKTKLSAHLADSEQRKLNRLLSEMPLGDKRPSELFHDMKQVAGTVLGEAALKGLWVQRLPESARAVVTASSGPASEFTKIADSIIDALAQRPVHQVAATPLNEISELKAVIAELRNQINNFPRNSRPRSRGSSNQRSRTPANNEANANAASNASANANAESDLCWYHQTYGRDARNCRSPCRRSRRSRNPAPSTPHNPA